MFQRRAQIGLAVVAATLLAVALVPLGCAAQTTAPAGPVAAPAAAAAAGSVTTGGRQPVTLILGAFGQEVRLLDEAVQGAKVQQVRGLKFTTGLLGGRQVVICLSGIGKVNAAMTVTAAIVKFEPAEVIFTGIAGGVNPELRPGDIVLGARVGQHDYGDLTEAGMKVGPTRSPITNRRNPVLFPADERLLALASAAAKEVKWQPVSLGEQTRVPRVQAGTIVTGDVFVASESKSKSLRQDLQADATEMEGAAVAQVCYQFGVPCLVIRSLSDNADSRAMEDLRKFQGQAAHNSAALVEAVVARLAASPATAPAKP
jgi:adenosylhomocysteine nucleosidase